MYDLFIEVLIILCVLLPLSIILFFVEKVKRTDSTKATHFFFSNIGAIVLGVFCTLIVAPSESPKEEISTSNVPSVSTNMEKQTPSPIENSSTPVEVIVYQSITANTLLDELESNALRAETNYNDSYLQITGKLSNIDSDGSYISLQHSTNTWNWQNVQCFIKDKEQLNVVMNMQIGQIITVSGQITAIGEILGYQLDIHSIP